MNIQKTLSAVVLAVVFCSSNVMAYIDWINPVLVPMLQRRIVRITPVLIPVYRQRPEISPLLLGVIASRHPLFIFELISKI